MTAAQPGSMPAAAIPAATDGRPGKPRDPDLILARVHLLLGSLSLARTELETLAGRGALDDEAIRDLAEARWRTGDLAGAGEAAAAWLEGHPTDILGLVIAAESQAALGRPGEARRLAGRAMERANGSLDPVFAGMQRSAIWPVEAGAASGPVGVLFDDLHPGPQALDPLVGTLLRSGQLRGPGGRSGHEPPDPRDGPTDAFGQAPPPTPATGPSLWGDAAAGMDAAIDDEVDPTALFHQARVALEAGQTTDAATGLILALRAAPGLAPAVLDLLAGRSESILALVRGDAKRIVGREVEAMHDHAVAAGGLSDEVAVRPAATRPQAPSPTSEPSDAGPTAGSGDAVPSASPTPDQEDS